MGRPRAEVAADHQRRLGARARRVVALLPILVRREIRTRYRTSVLDLGWAIVTPVALMAVYGVVLTRSFDVTAHCSPYLTSAWVGVVLWTAFANAVGGAAGSLTSSADLITKVYFPLEAMPLSVAAVSLLDMAVGLLSLIGLALVQGVHLGPTAFAAVLPIAVLIVWTALISMVTAVLATFVRDVIHGVALALRLGFFATPVMYEVDFLPATLRWTATVNPIAASITGVRDTMLCGTAPATAVLAVHLLVGLGAAVLAVAYTRSVESRVVDVV
jgi:ABC-2 type transport system permease protein/lipopolysaccharide transport system permease protein